MSKNIYFVQVSAVICDKQKSIYLPYSVGCLAAYAWNNPRFSEAFRFGRFVYVKEDIDTSVASLDNPYAVAFSCYVWNNEYSNAYARRVREVWPDAKIIFGGHNLSPDGRSLTNKQFIDAVIHGEGEETFTELMLAYNDASDLAAVNGITFRDKDGVIHTTSPRTLGDVTDYPSPYLTGYFDDIIKEDVYKFPVVWETNRGCPNCCAFCDWGTICSKVRFFPIERIKKEIEWMAENQIEYIYGADANFGMFPRDAEIADILIKSNESTGYPCKFKMNYSFFKNDTVFEIGKKLFKHGIGKYLTLSFQTLSPEVADIIGRKNMNLDRFRELIVKYNEAGLPVYSELILGLPGETYESFTDGIDTLLSCNQHTMIAVYPCELLPNSRLGTDEYIQKYQIVVKRKRYVQQHTKPLNNEIPEYSETVFSTSTLSLDDWMRTYRFAQCIHTFHNLGLLRVAAIYAHYEKGMSYKAFYEWFTAWGESLPKSTLTGSVFAELNAYVTDIQDSDVPFYRTYEGMGDILWEFEEYACTRIAVNKERFYDEIVRFLSNIETDEDKLKDLIAYQKAIIKSPGRSVSEVDMRYDFHSFFLTAGIGKPIPLEKRTVHLRFTDENPTSTCEEYTRVNIWFGRMEDSQLFTGSNSLIELLEDKPSEKKEYAKVTVNSAT